MDSIVDMVSLSESRQCKFMMLLENRSLHVLAEKESGISIDAGHYTLYTIHYPECKKLNQSS